MKPLEWQELWDMMDAKPELWIPTTEKQYWAILEAVPPTVQLSDAFLGGEPNHHNRAGEPVYAAFRRIGGEYSARHLSLRQFRNRRSWI
jgi:hypothetical protein